MSQIQQLNINLEGIGGVLKSRRFRVPAYQPTSVHMLGKSIML